LRKLIAHRGADVLCSDPHVRDPRLVPLEVVLEEADLLVVGAPHSAYRGLDLSGHEVADIWNITGAGITL